MKKCDDCNGTGKQYQIVESIGFMFEPGFERIELPCSFCFGRGQIFDCLYCDDTGALHSIVGTGVCKCKTGKGK